MPEAHSIIVQNIKNTKKYKNLDKELIHKLIDNDTKQHSTKHNIKEIEKNIRNILHQSYGIYLADTNWLKLTEKLESTPSESMKQTVNQIAKNHISTRERYEQAYDIFSYIFSGSDNATKIKTVSEIGCALNPLLLFLTGFFSDIQYQGYDIDHREIEFINTFFRKLGCPHTAEVKAFHNTANLNSDVILIMKVLPVLRHQYLDSEIKAVINSYSCEKLVISFPAMSLSGKNVGMKENYTAWTQKFFEHTKFIFADKKPFINEELFIFIQQ